MKNNTKKFLEHMNREGITFEKVCDDLGKYNALIFYLQQFEKWLNDTKSG